MAKVDLPVVPSGQQLRTTVNANFAEIETVLNDNVLWRDNPVGEPNQLEQDLDLNGNDILNATSVSAQEVRVNGVALIPTSLVKRDYDPTGDWVSSKSYTSNQLWKFDGSWYLVLDDYISGASPAADISSGAVAVHQIRDWVASVNTWADLETSFEPAFDGQIVCMASRLNLPVPRSSTGGGMFYADFSDTTTPSDGGVVAVTAGGKRLKRIIDGSVTPEMFGAVGNGVADDTAPLQSALDYFGTIESLYNTGGKMVLGKARYKTTSPLKLKSSWTTIEGQGRFNSIISYTGTAGTAAIQFGADMADQNLVITYLAIKGFTIQVYGDGCYAVQYDKAQYATTRELSVELTAANQVGFYGNGNGSGAGPYYNLFDDIVVVGSGLPTQIGFKMRQNSFASLDSPNANIFSNIKQIQSVGVGFDIETGHSNTFKNIGLESISQYGFKLSHKPPRYTGTATGGGADSLIDTSQDFHSISNGTLRITSGTGAGSVIPISTSSGNTIVFMQQQTFIPDATTVYEVYTGGCSETKIDGLRYEDGGAIVISNGYGANRTQVTNFNSTGESKTWENLSLDQDSTFGTSSGNVIPFTFQSGELNAASTTFNLTPVGVGVLGIGGGWRLPQAGKIISVATSMEGIATSGATGSLEVKTYMSGANKTALNHTINQTNRLGYTQVAPESDTQASRNSALTVRISTDASWNQITAKATVVILVAV